MPFPSFWTNSSNENKSLTVRNASTDLILNLSFPESLDLETYAAAASEAALAHARAYLPGPGPGTTLSLNTLRAVCEKNTMLVGLSPKLSKRLKDNSVKWVTTKTGERIGEVRDLSGRFAGKAREVGQGVKAVRTAALAATVVVEASHLIASADMARMQRETIEKLDRLEAYHHIANEARLENLYYRAREILAKPLNAERQQELRLIRSDLRELRIVWRKEIQHNLSQIKDPRNSGWFNIVTTGQESRDEKLISNITSEVNRFALLDYTLRLGHTLGLASETWLDTQASDEAELEELKKLGKLLEEKCRFVSEKRISRVLKISNSFSQIPVYYEELLENYNSADPEKLLPAINQSLAE